MQPTNFFRHKNEAPRLRYIISWELDTGTKGEKFFNSNFHITPLVNTNFSPLVPTLGVQEN